jgi:hypothetical protein
MKYTSFFYPFSLPFVKRSLGGQPNIVMNYVVRRKVTAIKSSIEAVEHISLLRAVLQ